MLRVEGAVVRFGTVAAVDGVDLEVREREVVAVLGPSGCGKSTLLRAIAGLEPLGAGRVTWDGADLAGVPPDRRRFGLMFQDYALFPHRDVRGNVEFGLRMAGEPRAVRAARVDEVLDLVGLTDLARRRVAALSGGEQQRVALARALAPAPRMLMLDEPLGALDRSLRDRLLEELQVLLGGAGVPSLYVTHDHEEAFTIADRIAVMRAGRIVQTGAPEAVWRRPADPWTAAFLGFGAAVDGDVVAGAGVDTAWGRLPVPEGAPPGPAHVVLRPDALRLDPAGALRGVVRRRSFAGERVVLAVALGSGPEVELRVDAVGAPHPGDEVGAAVNPDGVLLYPR